MADEKRQSKEEIDTLRHPDTPYFRGLTFSSKSGISKTFTEAEHGGTQTPAERQTSRLKKQTKKGARMQGNQEIKHSPEDTSSQTSERNLWAAVVQQAAEDAHQDPAKFKTKGLRENAERHRDQARAWSESDRETTGTLKWICKQLGVDHERTQAWLTNSRAHTQALEAKTRAAEEKTERAAQFEATANLGWLREHDGNREKKHREAFNIFSTGKD